MADPAAAITSGMQSVPVRQMLRDLALGITEAQQQLDGASLRALKQAANQEIEIGGERASLLSLGLIPTFYQFREATIELSFSMSMQTEEEMSLGASMNLDVSSEPT